VPTVVEMQSEGGATGAIHGALQAGSLATTLSARGKKVAREVGMGGRINTAMQLCFFMLNGILPRDEAIWRAHG
jgi:Pyruvate/2-oxoacid:ferredoxin oxidoreductase gamma subunit